MIFLIYDSKCLMCNNFIQIVDKFYINKKEQLHIFPDTESFILFLKTLNKSSHFKLFLSKANLDNLSRKTIILIINRKIFIESDAVLNLMIFSGNKTIKYLSKFLLFFIPAKIRNFIYKLIAANRIHLSRIFKSSCSIKYKNLIAH